jgi:hypothetical protein
VPQAVLHRAEVLQRGPDDLFPQRLNIVEGAQRVLRLKG